MLRCNVTTSMRACRRIGSLLSSSSLSLWSSSVFPISSVIITGMVNTLPKEYIILTGFYTVLKWLSMRIWLFSLVWIQCPKNDKKFRSIWLQPVFSDGWHLDFCVRVSSRNRTRIIGVYVIRPAQQGDAALNPTQNDGRSVIANKDYNVQPAGHQKTFSKEATNKRFSIFGRLKV